ncbi:MAG: hypothetical protein ACRDRP_14635 [Pseudonocardiaceae bacterium]
MTTDTTTSDPAQLRAALADYIRGRKTFRTSRVEDAFRTVPRHVFLQVHDEEPAEHLDLWLTTTSPSSFGRLSVGSAAPTTHPAGHHLVINGRGPTVIMVCGAAGEAAHLDRRERLQRG